MAQIKDLTKEQLWQLRQQVTLNSLFLNDYCNSFGIDEKECNTFFDGYVEYLYEKAEIYQFATDDFFEIVDKYDNAENLYEWFSSIEW